MIVEADPGRDDYREVMRSQVAAMPRVKFICERDWTRGPNVYALGLAWDRNFDAEPGEMIYRRRFIFRLFLRFQLDRE